MAKFHVVVTSKDRITRWDSFMKNFVFNHLAFSWWDNAGQVRSALLMLFSMQEEP